jgi:hypothetical protein
VFAISKKTVILTIHGNRIRFLQPTIFNGAIPLPLYKIQIIGIKSIPRDIVFGKGNLKFLTLKGIEDIPQINVCKNFIRK